MPGCSQCRKLVGGQCLAHEEAKGSLGRNLSPPPLGACVIPILEDYLGLIRPGMSVLEVGCGSWDRLKRSCQEVGAHYEGIDTAPVHFGRPTAATRLENLAALSFPEARFDLVIGLQTMEHWPEQGCSLPWGLYQCFRGLKPQGLLLMNVPIHFHGARPFIQGRLDTLRQLLAPFSGRVSFEVWGYPSNPLPPCLPHRGYRPLNHKPAYILDIRALKDRPLPGNYRRRGLSWKIPAKLLNYPLSYTVYCILRKIGIFPKMGVLRDG